MKSEYLSILLILLVFNGCSKDEPPPIVPPPPPPPDYRNITLAVEDISYTEAWINVKTDSISFPATITLLKNTNEEKFVLFNSDTTVYVDSLQPNVNYTFQAVLTGDTIRSDTVKAKTLEPTSHNFTWETWEFGTHSSSALYDVAIIDENNIWAVGEIYMNDSLGNPDPHAYNAAHWDGTQWELKKIMFPTVCGSVNRTSYPAKSIFAFQDGEIWIGSSGDKIAILENGIQTAEFCLPSALDMGINKLWGTSSNDLYVVGNGGNIAHYSGPSGGWQKIESGTDLNIYDIWGDVNPQTGEYEILCVASNIFFNEGNRLLKILNNSVTEVTNDGLPWSLFTLWFKPGRTYYVGGDGMYNVKRLGESWTKDLSLPTYYKSSIRGQALNDIVLCGVYGLLMHNNGVEWKNYQYTVFEFDKTFANIEIKENVVSASGSFGSKAFITIGVRK